MSRKSYAYDLIFKWHLLLRSQWLISQCKTWLLLLLFLSLRDSEIKEEDIFSVPFL